MKATEKLKSGKFKDVFNDSRSKYYYEILQKPEIKQKKQEALEFLVETLEIENPNFTHESVKGILGPIIDPEVWYEEEKEEEVFAPETPEEEAKKKAFEKTAIQYIY